MSMFRGPPHLLSNVRKLLHRFAAYLVRGAFHPFCVRFKGDTVVITETDYEAVMPLLQDLDDTTTPTNAAGVVIHEARTVYFFAKADKPELVAAGLDWNIVESVPMKDRAFRHAQANWKAVRQILEKTDRKWREEEPLAVERRDDLATSFRYAFRNRPDLLNRVADIVSTTGQANMIQQLYELSVLGRKNQDLLTAVGFDLAELESAAVKAEELTELRAAREADINAHPVKKTRDQTFTLLKQALDAIRACGRFAFRKDPAWAARYTAAWFHRPRAGGNGNAREVQPVVENGQATTDGQPETNGRVPPDAVLNATTA